MDRVGLRSELSRQVGRAGRSHAADRELYACDASLYRRLPAGILRARSTDDLGLAIDLCRRFGAPLTMRGAGTSLAGQTVGDGLVVDTSALRGLTIDPDARTAIAEPGVVLDDLNRAAAHHGLLFGPDVATASRATIGGMVANNSAGARSIAYGMTSDNVTALDVILADGTEAHLSADSPPPDVLLAARALAEGFAPPRLLRRVSGYRLDALTGETPRWHEIVCGSEGTLAVVVRAHLRLRPLPERRGLVLRTYPGTDAALDAVPEILESRPSAVELLDRAMLDPASREGIAATVERLGLGGRALLIVEYQGDAGTVESRLSAERAGRVIRDPSEQETVWALRRAGIARAVGAGRGAEKPLPFVEDPAVPPEHLSRFARGFRQVLDDEQVRAAWYGHASVGCLHVRPFIDLRAAGARAQVRRIAEATAELVVDAGGSLSGEHGDGRSRSEFLPLMYPQRTIRAFEEVKHLLDPQGILNPGVIVRPDRMDEGLRMDVSPDPRVRRTVVSFAREGGVQVALEACNGNGTCRKQTVAMCPSYQAIREEEHSTRGRAVLLRAAFEGRLDGGLANDDLHRALEMCLGCKACASECPAGVDMARLKVEALAERHRVTRLPLTARAVSRTHVLLRVGSLAPLVANAAARLARPVLGFRPPRVRRAWRPRPGPGDGPEVVVVADSFTRFLHPESGDAAIAALEACGARVTVVPAGDCGRPAHAEGRVELARRQLLRSLDRLAPHARRGVPIVVLEPSIWSMLVDDAVTITDDDRIAPVSERVRTFEQVVLDLGVPGALVRADRGPVVVQPHCHQRALGAADAVTELLTAVGYSTTDSGAGCCGGAGSFMYRHDLPELRRFATRTADPIAAPGISCRMSLARSADPSRLLTTAELIMDGVPAPVGAGSGDWSPPSGPDRARRTGPSRHGGTS